MTSGIHRFAAFELDRDRRALRLEGREIPLQPRVPDLSAVAKMNGTSRRLMDLISVDDQYRSVAQSLLGEVVLVPDLQSAVALWRQNGIRVTLVTPEGDVVDPSGVITGGSDRPIEEEIIARRVAQRKLNMLLLGLFGLLGLVISAVGIYGVMAYVVSQRTREIGVRMALGASRGRVVGMVMGNAGVLVAVGLLIGTAGAWYLSTTAQTFLFQLDSNDPRAFAAAIVSLAVAGLIASAIPARRAASVDPMEALRAE